MVNLRVEIKKLINDVEIHKKSVEILHIYLISKDYKNKKPYPLWIGFSKEGGDILSHKMQYHLRRRA